MSDRTRKRLAAGWVVLVVASIIGFVVSMFLDAFVLDPFNAYGEVPIPGIQTLHLPDGDVKVSFHTETVGTISGGELPVPQDLEVAISPPSGVAQPQLTRAAGDTTAVNQDAHIQVGLVHITAAGDYTIKTNGKVNAYVSPRVSFGHGGDFGFLPWLSAGLFGVSLVGWVASRPRRKPTVRPKSTTPLQKLTNIAVLHDSGALSDEEYEAEKRRLLDGL